MKLTTKKILWLLSMGICLSMLALVINSRLKLSSEVIIGGADTAFVQTSGVKDALDGYDEVGKVHVKAPEGLTYPHVDIEDWHYMLANADNSIYEYTPTLKTARQSGVYFYTLAIGYLNDMLQAAEEQGFTPYVNCSYQSYSSQQQAYNEEVAQLVAGGYSMDEAEEVAKKIVAYPGTNEHQTGLAVDIFDKYYDEAPGYDVMNPEFFAWLDEHCAEFGFIKRYPTELKTLTGYDEPWHYRFVGKEAAAFIMENGLCLEQFEAYYR